MVQTYIIPSVIEANGFELNNVASELIKGLKLIHEDNLSYIVGDLAIAEGTSPHKTINSSPEDADYRLLAKAALLVASKKADGTFYVTTGFPFLSFQFNRQKALEFFQANHTIRYDASTFSNVINAEQSISVVKAMVIPELQGCNLAIREGEMAGENFFIVSLGYGTFEAALSTPSGLVQRTTVSGPGMRYAVSMAVKELLRTHNIGLKAEHQFDQGFVQGRMVINRNVINIEEIRRKYLQIYYNEVISPAMHKAFSDKDFSSAKKLVLVGGGANYTELQEMFTREFNGILDVKVQPEPALCAAKGYCIHSKATAEGYNAVSVGIDIGNANTVVSVLKNGASSFSQSQQIEE